MTEARDVIALARNKMLIVRDGGAQTVEGVIGSDNAGFILTALREAGFATITEKQFVEVACMLYCLGATDRVTGRPQNAVSASRQAWRELNELVAKAAQGGVE